ncbi:MAG: phosphomannose isomerase type II C-terminal cupin domain [Nocardioidaceae bacterium]
MVIERDERPWGYYEVIDEAESFRVKRICVTTGHRLSYQRHRHRGEHWVVVSGEGVVTLDDVKHKVTVGSTIGVEVGMAHRMENVGTTDLLFIEVQTGTYFGEDDIERLDDDYGRHGA